jgi:hypothetical protein
MVGVEELLPQGEVVVTSPDNVTASLMIVSAITTRRTIFAKLRLFVISKLLFCYMVKVCFVRALAFRRLQTHRVTSVE